MEIENWPFQTLTNKLRVLVRTETDYSEMNENCVGTSNGQDGSDNLRWLKINFNGASLYPAIIILVNNSPSVLN